MMQVITQARRYPRLFRAIAIATITMLFTSLIAYALVPLVLVRVSTDPYTNGTSMHQTELEPDTFSWGSTIVSAFQVGRFSNGGSSNLGWATSTDNGATWVNGFLPGTTTFADPPGTWGRDTDPSVAYDAMHGVWMINGLPLPTGGTIGGAVQVSRSTDGGLTWQNPVNVVVQNGLDKNWEVCDNSPISPYYGHCYSEWDNNSAGNLLQMSTSTDGGLTWSAPLAPSGNPSGLGGQPVVQSNGTVIVPYSANNSAIRSFRSTNGGVSWSTVTTIATNSTHSVAGSLRTSPLPSAEVDPRDRVFVVWQDCRFRTGCTSNDIVMSSSTDGLTWSAVTRIPIDPVTSTVDHFIPGIGVEQNRADPVAHLALTYYYYPVASCTTATCQLYVGFVSSVDGGATWTAPTQLAGPMTVTWLASTTQGYMVGDYISTSISLDGRAHTVFSVATAPVGGVFDEAMYAPVPGLSLRSKPPTLSSAGDKPVFFAPSDRPLPRGLPTAR